LAKWAEVDAIDRFEATVVLKRISSNRFGYRAVLTCDIVQSCVVTLEPVRSHIERELGRELHFAGHKSRLEVHSEALTLAAAEDEAPEEIESLDFDIAAPLLEELSLAIDPYPRAPGVAFAPPTTGELQEESPFAALKSLKERR
jgi:hypothetical protein